MEHTLALGGERAVTRFFLLLLPKPPAGSSHSHVRHMRLIRENVPVMGRGTAGAHESWNPHYCVVCKGQTLRSSAPEKQLGRCWGGQRKLGVYCVSQIQLQDLKWELASKCGQQVAS